MINQAQRALAGPRHMVRLGVVERTEQIGFRRD
jgi:hypothetical protein